MALAGSAPGSPGIPSALGPPSSIGPRQAQMAPSAGAKDRRLLPAPRRTVPFPARPHAHWSQDGAVACQEALEAPVLLSCVPSRSPLPLSLLLCFLTACPVLWECCDQKEVSRGREGSLPSSVEGLENGLSQEMEGGQDIPWGFPQRSGFVFINSRT